MSEQPPISDSEDNQREQPLITEGETELNTEPVTVEAIAETIDETIAPEPPQATPAQATVTPPPVSGSAQSQTMQTLQRFWQTTQPKLRVGTIRALKTTIQLLQRAVSQLEAGVDVESGSDVETMIAPFTLPDWATNLWRTIQRGWQNFWTWWDGVLPKIRRVLPASINEALSDRALTGAIAGVLVVLLWLGSAIFSSKPPKQVAVVSPPKAAPTRTEKKPPKPKNMPEVKVIPPPKPAPTVEPVKPSPKAQPTTPTAEVPKPTPTPSPSPGVSPSPIASPIPTPTPKPSPPPLKLTPEQTLIARIQDHVAEVSDQYASGLIQSVQANFRAGRLMVKLGEGWYALSPVQQDNLANDVLKRAQQLNFVKLKMMDMEGELLARSPVIGSDMIVLQRSHS